MTTTTKEEIEQTLEALTKLCDIAYETMRPLRLVRLYHTAGAEKQRLGAMLEGIYYVYEYDNERYDGTFETPSKAENWAQACFEEECEGLSPSNGETFYREIEVIGLTLDGDNEIEIYRQKETLEYEHYHGDAKEHGTWGN